MSRTSLVAEYAPKAAKERKGVIIDHALEKIYKKHKTVTADVVLREATAESHDLHHFFEWDNETAGDRYRLMQAYGMILASKFVVRLVESGRADTRTVTETAQVRRLVNVFRGEGFVLRTDALKDAGSRTAIIESKKSQLRSWCNSVADLPEFEQLRNQILASL